MPGLLDTKGCNFYTIKFAIAVVAEMLGVFVFAFYSSKAPAEYAAWANGLSLAVVGARQPLWPRAHAFLSMVCMPSCTPGCGMEYRHHMAITCTPTRNASTYRDLPGLKHGIVRQLTCMHLSQQCIS